MHLFGLDTTHVISSCSFLHNGQRPAFKSPQSRCSIRLNCWWFACLCRLGRGHRAGDRRRRRPVRRFHQFSLHVLHNVRQQHVSSLRSVLHLLAYLRSRTCLALVHLLLGARCHAQSCQSPLSPARLPLTSGCCALVSSLCMQCGFWRRYDAARPQQLQIRHRSLHHCESARSLALTLCSTSAASVRPLLPCSAAPLKSVHGTLRTCLSARTASAVHQ